MRRAILAAASLALAGCFSARYLAQAANGERHILMSARPIADVRRDPKTPPRIAALLARVGEIKAFGRENGLKPTKNYTRYADLRRPAAVWVVEACAPLSFTPKRWHFPIAGSVPYLGFFHEKAAQKYAARIAAKEHLDVEVRTAGAFSTLGWFKDPVLSTMIPEGDEALGELANVVLHESLHATLYVKNQSVFNESLASFVADRLTAEWLEAHAPAEAEAWKNLEAQYVERVARLHAAWAVLDALYRSDRTDAEKLAEKARILGALKDELGLRREINNATIAGYQTYDTGAPQMAALFEACGGSWPRFLGALRTLRSSDFSKPQQEDFAPLFAPLITRGCAP